MPGNTNVAPVKLATACQYSGDLLPGRQHGKKKEEKTMPLGMMQGKLMDNPSFPFRQHHALCSSTYAKSAKSQEQELAHYQSQ